MYEEPHDDEIYDGDFYAESISEHTDGKQVAIWQLSRRRVVKFSVFLIRAHSPWGVRKATVLGPALPGHPQEITPAAIIPGECGLALELHTQSAGLS